MNSRQKILKAVYPFWMAFTKLIGKNTTVLKQEETAEPQQSLYDLQVQLNNGQMLPLSTYKGRKILLVNTASECGYTPQYTDLQKLYEQYNNKLVVIGFPANDFKEQESGTDEQIASFCQINFGVKFPLAKKSVVVKGQDQNPVFKWLTQKSQNGWNEKQPTWNFSKYLVDEGGRLTHYFDPSVEPMSSELVSAVKS